jgi:hypothetical protein
MIKGFQSMANAKPNTAVHLQGDERKMFYQNVILRKTVSA